LRNVRVILSGGEDMRGNGQSAGESDFATLLRLHRKRLAMSQEDLSEATKGRVAVRTISDLERGVARQPRSATLRLLAEALGLSGDESAAFTAAARPARCAEAAAATAELKARARREARGDRAAVPAWPLMTPPPVIIMLPVIPLSLARRSRKPRSRPLP
jgi:transcriptional regulator with XRE-family HTH domain